ncbi:recombinase family protein [Pseudoalteromonas sp. Of7M-16]|uniref:recombinase family protein n=1 Tax=Pseudoalteromonas sp. Of7M-16 TaxID=2917756 RepID=UPI001EF4ACDC|nr:recombinase family protein [Pseudoalteromonas sp. Of7M-16]MCG7551591.1 recombinase family protein [Pseudoalteromonas sp. Of7M-16]
MAKNYAYVRISDNKKQDSKGQIDRINKYAEDNGLYINKWYQYELSGSKTTKVERGLVDLIERLTPGDRVLVNDIERFGRDAISEILEVITRILNAGAELHFCLNGEVLSGKHRTDPIAFYIAVGKAFAAQDFSTQRSMKAKAAAQRRKRHNLPIGRPPGTIVKSRLDDSESRILFWLSQEVTKSEIARREGVAISTLDKWLYRRDELICMARDLGVFKKGMNICQIKKELKLKTKNSNEEK